ncbi:MAG: hydrogenase maturation nickel metallochaperone HypA [Alphaproteobacteria bacterium]|nr:hydrogenase maturation nickel metallochaperone HypA [Alphaproteobacteria bacterium]
MHEMSLCAGMLRIIERQAEQDKFRRVLTVRVELGEYAGVSEESLCFCFPIMAKGTIAEEAKLEFTHTLDQALRIIDLDVV